MLADLPVCKPLQTLLFGENINLDENLALNWVNTTTNWTHFTVTGNSLGCCLYSLYFCICCKFFLSYVYKVNEHKVNMNVFALCV